MIIQTCTCNKLQRQALQKPEMTLSELLLLGRTMALAEMQASGMEQPQHSAIKEHTRGAVMAVDVERGALKKRCYNCSGSFPHRDGMQCPARGKMCNSCGKQGHFAKCCRSKRPQGGIRGPHEVHYVHTSGDGGMTSQATGKLEDSAF